MEKGNQLNSIKNYLLENGVIVDEVILWQSGFKHDGFEFGLTVIATCIINNEEKIYYVPRNALFHPIKFLRG